MEEEESKNDDEDEDEEAEIDHNELYRLFKNMDILGQILRNKFGSFTREQLAEIVDTAIEGGLRVVSVLVDRDNVLGVEDFLVEVLREEEKLGNREGTEWEEEVRMLARTLFFWAMCGVMYKTVAVIGRPELIEVVGKVCDEYSTPAYDLIRFLFAIATSSELNEKHVDCAGGSA